MKKKYITPEAYSGEFAPEQCLLDVSANIDELELVDDTWDY